MHLVYWSTSQYVEPMAVRRTKIIPRRADLQIVKAKGIQEL